MLCLLTTDTVEGAYYNLVQQLIRCRLIQFFRLISTLISRRGGYQSFPHVSPNYFFGVLIRKEVSLQALTWLWSSLGFSRKPILARIQIFCYIRHIERVSIGINGIPMVLCRARIVVWVYMQFFIQNLSMFQDKRNYSAKTQTYKSAFFGSNSTGSMAVLGGREESQWLLYLCLRLSQRTSLYGVIVGIS